MANQKRRMLLMTVGTALSTLIAGCSGGENEEERAPDEHWIKGDNFEPIVLTVEVGTEVTWVNKDAHNHDLTSTQLTDEGEEWDFNSLLSSQGEDSYTFEQIGIYQLYSDTPYTDEASTCGAVIVKEEGDEEDEGLSMDESLPCE